jgi:putative ABC transport system permease protein
MKPIFYNLLGVVRRFKLAAVLNILGLSVAFAAFMIIMIQLDYDNSFDKFHKDSGKIFRMEMARQTEAYAIVSRPFAERFFESSPHIVAGAIINPTGKLFGDDLAYFHVEKDGVRNFYKEKSVQVSPGFTDVFTFDIAEGTDDALKTHGNVIIPLSMARKLFGNESAVGGQLVYDWGSQTVGAVYRDFPANTIVNNVIYVPMPEDENKENWGNQIYYGYIRVNDASNVPFLFDNFKRNFDASVAFGQGFGWEESGIVIRFTALQDIHFVTGVQFDETPKSSRQTLMILFAIAVVIIVIAAINFTNFSTALTPMRVKSINTQRVLGARRATLRLSLIFEAVFISFLSYLVALLLVSIFHDSPLARLVDADLSFSAHQLIFGGTALIAALTGIFAGVYPSRYITSFAPALVLKGSFGLSPKGRKLRNTLIAVQFVASFALIIGASFMFLQNHFMQNSSLGYDKEALITVDIRQIQKNRDVFTNQIQAYAGVEEVTYGQFLLSSTDSYMKWGLEQKGELINFQVLPVHHTFLKTMGIELSEGRDFRYEDANTQHGAWIFNETARKQYNLELNTMIEGWVGGEIIGFMPDLKIASFRMAVEPMAFFVPGTEKAWIQTNVAYIKLRTGTNLRAAMSHIYSTLAGFDTGYPFEVRFYDEVLQRLYEKETSLSSLISLFSIMAIFISIVGVFGLVVFDSECRRKEIGIRKVLGASTMGIIIMFNKSYFKILAICFVIAAPLAWYAVHRWLENFAYKTPMYWWVYLLALVVVAVITAGTITFQSWRVANDNPVNALKKDT